MELVFSAAGCGGGGIQRTPVGVGGQEQELAAGMAGETGLEGGTPVSEGEGFGDRHGELAFRCQLRAMVQAELVQIVRCHLTADRASALRAWEELGMVPLAPASR